MKHRALVKPISARSSSRAAMAAVLVAGGITAPAHARAKVDREANKQSSFADEIIVTARHPIPKAYAAARGLRPVLGWKRLRPLPRSTLSI